MHPFNPPQTHNYHRCHGLPPIKALTAPAGGLAWSSRHGTCMSTPLCCALCILCTQIPFYLSFFNVPVHNDFFSWRLSVSLRVNFSGKPHLMRINVCMFSRNTSLRYAFGLDSNARRVGKKFRTCAHHAAPMSKPRQLRSTECDQANIFERICTFKPNFSLEHILKSCTVVVSP